MAADANNYSTWSEMKLPVIKVEPETELSFDWGSVTEDFITHSLDAKKDLNLMMVLLFQLPLSDLEKKLNADSLTQNDLAVSPPLTLRTNGSDTSAEALRFHLNGTTVTPEMVLKYFDANFYAPADYTYAFAGANTGIRHWPKHPDGSSFPARCRAPPNLTSRRRTPSSSIGRPISTT